MMPKIVKDTYFCRFSVMCFSEKLANFIIDFLTIVLDAFIRITQCRDVTVENSRELLMLYSQVFYSILIDNLPKSKAEKWHVETAGEPQTSSAFQQLYRIEHVLKKLLLDYPRQVSVFI